MKTPLLRWKRLCVLWLSITFVAVFVILSRLLLAHSPILDFGSAEQKCRADAWNAGQSLHRPRSNRHLAGVSCPDPYLTADISTRNSESWSKFRQSLAAYKTFHKKQLRDLKNGRKVRTLTWSCSQSKCSGMGDQLFRIQFFLLLAVMSNRTFIVHWDEALQRSAKYLLPNEIDWSYFNETKGMCTDDEPIARAQVCSKTTFDATSIWGFGWNKEEFKDFGETLFGREEHITVTGRVIAQGVMYVGKESVLDPGNKIREGFDRLGVANILGKDDDTDGKMDAVRCQHKSPWYHLLRKFGIHHLMEVPEMNNGEILATEPWLQVSHVLLCYLFKFPSELTKEVNKLSKNMRLDQGKYLGVHLRTGFKGMPHEESFATQWYFRNYKMFDEVYIWDGILQYSFDLATKVLGTDSVVYLSTDTDLAKERYLKMYGTRLKVTNLTEIHPIYSRSKCEGQTNSQTESDHIASKIHSDPHASMWIDFFLLGRANIMVHGDSAFSENACFLKPIAHHNHVWFMHDYSRNCIASYVGGNTSCIVQYR